MAVRAKLPEHYPAQPTEGNCHCEAGLMALILRHVDIGTEVVCEDKELHPLAKALETMKDMPRDATFAIGVAKKCCPICCLLADIIKVKFEVDFELPGKHSTYRAWIPLQWLPSSVFQELEINLLGVVSRMISAGGHLQGSRPSSPGGGSSDPGRSGLGPHLALRPPQPKILSW
ncbi:hypothetical protein DFH09DRAFT_580700 [Mycena vulgaris]|nr:hypothetical protein DFH09DRAFT_580700 [Mycena vulgaris]